MGGLDARASAGTMQLEYVAQRPTCRLHTPDFDILMSIAGKPMKTFAYVDMSITPIELKKCKYPSYV